MVSRYTEIIKTAIVPSSLSLFPSLFLPLVVSRGEAIWAAGLRSAITRDRDFTRSGILQGERSSERMANFSSDFKFQVHYLFSDRVAERRSERGDSFDFERHLRDRPLIGLHEAERSEEQKQRERESSDVTQLPARIKVARTEASFRYKVAVCSVWYSRRLAITSALQMH